MPIVKNLPVTTTYAYSAVGMDELGSTEYTLVNLVVDVTGSTSGFVNELERCVRDVYRACKKASFAEKILFRVNTFNSSIGNMEVHGYFKLSDIDENIYKFSANGTTNLYDVTYQNAQSMIDYAMELDKYDFTTNGILVVITDGQDNASSVSVATIKNYFDSIIRNEALESFMTILIGINDKDCAVDLNKFSTDVNFTQYVSAGDVSPSKIAKIANFISQSISSQSQALGTGGPSQALTF